MIILSYVAPDNYTNQTGTFTVDVTVFKTPNTQTMQKIINDDGCYFISCSSSTTSRESNFFMSKYVKPNPDTNELNLTIVKRHDYDRNKPVADSLGPGQYEINIDLYWGLYEHNIQTLEDVQINDPLNDGQVLKWNSLLAKFVNSEDVAGPATLAALTDVELTAPVDSQFLKYNVGTAKWENKDLNTTIDQLSNVVITSPINDNVLAYDDLTGNWVNKVASGGATSLNDLTDVDLIGVLSPSETMVYNSNTAQFTNCPPAIKKALYQAAAVPTASPLAGEFSIVDGGGGPNSFYINQVDKNGRDFSIQLSNWFIANVRDLSFSSTSESSFIVSINTVLTLTGDVWGAQTNTAPISPTPNALYTVELDARNLLYVDNANNVSLNQNDNFNIGTGNMNLSGEFVSGITSGMNNLTVGSNAAITSPTAMGNVVVGMGAQSAFDNTITLGANCTARESNCLHLNNMTTSTSAVGGAATALPVAPEGYLTVYLNNGLTGVKIAYYL